MAKEVKEGDKVQLFNDTPGGLMLEGTVVLVQDEVGKKIGVELNDHHPIAHSLDGRVEEGYGWWALPENIAVIPQK